MRDEFEAEVKAHVEQARAFSGLEMIAEHLRRRRSSCSAGGKNNTRPSRDARVQTVKVNTEWRGFAGAQRPHAIAPNHT